MSSKSGYFSRIFLLTQVIVSLLICELALADRLEYSETQYAMGTFLAIKLSLDDESLMTKEDLREISERMFSKVLKIEEEISHYQESSDLSKINRMTIGDVLPLQYYACQFLYESKFLFNAFSGLIDMNVGDGDYSDLSIDGCLASKRAMVKLDPSGLGKGFALDILADILHQHSDCIYVFINFGRSSVGYLGTKKCKARAMKMRHFQTISEKTEDIELPLNSFLTTSNSKNIINPRLESGSKRDSAKPFERYVITKSGIEGEALVKVMIINDPNFKY